MMTNDSSCVIFIYFYFFALDSLEYWYMSIIVLMSGYTEDANIAISAFSIWYYLQSSRN